VSLCKEHILTGSSWRRLPEAVVVYKGKGKGIGIEEPTKITNKNDEPMNAPKIDGCTK
jgi:hypothetical protein